MDSILITLFITASLVFLMFRNMLASEYDLADVLSLGRDTVIAFVVSTLFMVSVEHLSEFSEAVVFQKKFQATVVSNQFSGNAEYENMPLYQDVVEFRDNGKKIIKNLDYISTNPAKIGKIMTVTYIPGTPYVKNLNFFPQFLLFIGLSALLIVSGTLLIVAFSIATAKKSDYLIVSVIKSFFKIVIPFTMVFFLGIAVLILWKYFFDADSPIPLWEAALSGIVIIIALPITAIYFFYLIKKRNKTKIIEQNVNNFLDDPFKNLNL